MNVPETLRVLCDAPGVGGMIQAADRAASLLSPLTDQVWRDPLGNVCGIRRCPQKEAPTLLLEAHLDEIGLIVTGIDDKGFLRIDKCGGVDPRALAASPVTVWGSAPCPGVITSVPPHLAPKGEQQKLPELSALAVDVGLSAEEARACIRPGDRISFDAPLRELGNGRVTGKALDNRTGVTAVLFALSLLQGRPLPVHVAVCFAVQEELGGRGAAAAGFRLRPDAAIVTDVSFARTPDIREEPCGELGRGPMLGLSPVLHRGLTKALERLAAREDIPLQYEVMGGTTGTDADPLSTAAGGVRTALLSIPLRYMHTPAELAVIEDIEAVGRLMAAAAREGAIQ